MVLEWKFRIEAYTFMFLSLWWKRGHQVCHYGIRVQLYHGIWKQCKLSFSVCSGGCCFLRDCWCWERPVCQKCLKGTQTFSALVERAYLEPNVLWHWQQGYHSSTPGLYILWKKKSPIQCHCEYHRNPSSKEQDPEPDAWWEWSRAPWRKSTVT